jgi:hypothetical protein
VALTPDVLVGFGTGPTDHLLQATRTVPQLSSRSSPIPLAPVLSTTSLDRAAMLRASCCSNTV